MKPMYLPEVEEKSDGDGHYSAMIRMIRAAGQPVPQIMHLFAFKPEITDYLSRFTQGVMRAPSPLAPGMRELIAAFTSKGNHCPF
jgi:hypothetical protein